MSRKDEKLVGYYKQLHFKCDDLELFYNMPVVAPDDVPLNECPHINNLICSRAHELAPDKCVQLRKCEILELKDTLFESKGINALVLRDLDNRLRSS